LINIIIIGAGAAGLMAAIAASECKDTKVTVLEKNEKAGKKIYITGKGRCNITNDSDNEFD
jgi:predicted flavoprotein YhiN